MRKIWAVYKRDLKKIVRNGFALVIAIGIIFIPALYAWFNIHSNWDPYSNTKGIKIAVANEDAGSTMSGLNVNIGGMIVAKLAANDQIGWQFTDKEKALDGVKSSEYYAALIIPESFSKDMLSIASLDLKKPEIDYYVNEKKNAIAPKITNAGVNTVQLQVNETFIETASSVLSSVLQQADGELDGRKEQVQDELIGSLQKAKSSFEEYENLLGLIESSAASLNAALGSAQSSIPDLSGLGQAVDTAQADADTLENNTQAALQALSSSLSSLQDSLDDSLSDLQSSLDEVQKAADSMSSANNGGLQTLLGKSQEKTAAAIRLNNARITVLQKLDAALPIPLKGVQALLGKAEETADTLSAIDNVQRAMQSGLDSAEKLPDDLISQAKDEIGKAKSLQKESRDALQNDLNPDFSGLEGKIDASLQSAAALADAAQNSEQAGKDAITSTRQSLDAAGQSLESSKALLHQATEKLDATIQEIESVSADERLQKLSQLISRDPQLIAGFLKEPVSLKTTSIYPIRNYGSGMAPFYTVLAIWVGALVNVAILKTKIKDPEEFGGLTPTQAYFGRYLIFMTISILQAAVICLGDLYLLKIQCVEPGYFLLMGICTAITYSLLMYTLTLSFGDVGKALAVILMVIQVAGSGGTFPIECLPDLYQRLYPFFPFNFSINGMRECVAGIYQNAYWLDLLKLSAWIGVSLIIGLALRKPLIRMKEYIESKVEETGVIG